MRQGSLQRAAQVGMNKKYAEILRERAERQRMVELARGIHTEELLQQVLADVPEHLRAAVEKVLRPHTRIGVPDVLG